MVAASPLGMCLQVAIPAGRKSTEKTVRRAAPFSEMRRNAATGASFASCSSCGTRTGTTGGPAGDGAPSRARSASRSMAARPPTRTASTSATRCSIGDTEPQIPPDYPCEVVYILNDARTRATNAIGTPLGDVNREAAAVQSAIWYFTDGFVVTGPADVQSRPRDHRRRDRASAATCRPVPQELTLSPADATNYLPGDKTHSVTATLTRHGRARSWPARRSTCRSPAPPARRPSTAAPMRSGTVTIAYENALGRDRDRHDQGDARASPCRSA